LQGNQQLVRDSGRVAGGAGRLQIRSAQYARAALIVNRALVIMDRPPYAQPSVLRG